MIRTDTTQAHLALRAEQHRHPTQYMQHTKTTSQQADQPEKKMKFDLMVKRTSPMKKPNRY